jgi:hypothetical protein
LRSEQSIARMMDRMAQEPVTLVTVRDGDKSSEVKVPPSIPSRGVGSNDAATTGGHTSQHPSAEY